MTDSTNNTAKPKRNHLDAMLDDALSSLASDNELEDQDAIDKLLVDTGFDSDQEFDGLDDELDSFSNFDDFGEFAEPTLGTIPATEEPDPVVDLIEENDEASVQDDAIDKLLADSGFDNSMVLPTEDDARVDDFADFDDFGEFAEPTLGTIPATEEPEPEVESIKQSDELSDQDDAIDKLLADSGFDNAVGLPAEDDVLIDEFADFDDFGDFAEPTLATTPVTEEPGPVVDLIEENDEASVQDDAIDKLLADSGFDNAVNLPAEDDDVLIDEFADFDDFGEFAEPTLGTILATEEPDPVVDLIEENDEASVQDDAIDKLLADSGFDSNKEQPTAEISDEVTDSLPTAGFDEEFDQIDLTNNDVVEIMPTPTPPILESDEDEQIAEQLALMAKSGSTDGDEFFALDEIGDDLFIEPAASDVPIEDKSEDEFEEQVSGRNSDNEDDFLLADFDITADTDFPGFQDAAEGLDEFSENNFDSLNEPLTPEAPFVSSEPVEEINIEQVADLPVTAVAVENAESEALAQLKSEQERMDKQYKKQLIDAETKAKKAATFGYIALATGIVALGLAVGMGWMVFSAKSELSQLSQSVTTIKDDIDSQTVKNTDQDLTAVKTSVEQLNQKLDGVIEQLKGAPALAQQVQSHMQSPIAIPESVSKLHEIAPKKDVINKTLDIAPTHMADLHAPKSPEQHSDNVAVDQAANKPVDTAATTKPSDAAHVSAASPTDNKAAAVASSEVKSAPAKNIAVKKKPVKITKPAAEKRLSVNADWSVNLIAYKQDWYAKSKAAEFAQKGVPVEVIPVEVSGVTWYRLRVGGFKNKAEADSYASRVKKALNLSSVWVGDI